MYFTSTLFSFCTRNVKNCIVFISQFSVHDDFKSVIKECYAPYSPGAEDTAPFGLMNGTA